MAMDEILVDIRERLARIETKQDAQNGLREKIDTIDTRSTENEARGKSNTHRINKLEESYLWLWRTIAGAIIVAGIGALMIL